MSLTPNRISHTHMSGKTIRAISGHLSIGLTARRSIHHRASENPCVKNRTFNTSLKFDANIAPWSHVSVFQNQPRKNDSIMAGSSERGKRQFESGGSAGGFDIAPRRK